MKKKFQIIIVLLIILFKFDVASASTLQRDFIDNVWSFHYRDGKVWTFGQLNIKHMDGKLAYCIEPDSAVNTSDYTEYDDWSKSGYSEKIKNQMELYAYYGYQYPGHNTVRYYMATQELIWLFSNDEKIKWTKENHSDSEEINIEKEKNEILNLANRKYPSFLRSNPRGKVGTTLKLVDTNNVLQDFDYNPKLEISGNTASYYITPEIKNITVTSKNYLYDKTSVYISKIKSQTIAAFGNPEPLVLHFSIIPYETPITIIKKDKDTLKKINDKGNKIKIKNLTTKQEYIFDFENGEINYSFYPAEYSIEELSASKGYLLNSECIKFTVGDNSSTIDYFNTPVKGKIRIKKLDEQNKYLSGCTFNIYDKNKKIVDTIKTTENEYDESKMLPLGEYIVKEEKPAYGYKIDEKEYKVELKYKNEYENVFENLEITNEKAKCKTTIIGINDNDKEIDISFNIYDKNDNLVYSGNEREIKLEYGDYYITETKVENGYILNDEKIDFSINDNTCGTSLKILNEKVQMPITSTKNMSVLFFIIIILNFGIYKTIKKHS